MKRERVGDKNGILSFHDYWEGVTKYVHVFGTTPSLIFVDDNALGDLKNDELFVRQQDIITTDSAVNVKARYAIWRYIAEDGDGIYDDRPVYLLTHDDFPVDVGSKPTMILTDSSDMHDFVVVEG